MVIRAELVFDVGVVAPDSVAIFYRMPLVESAAFADLVAEVPLAEVGLVVVVGDVIDDGVDLIRQRDVVLIRPVGVRPSAGHDG